LGVALVGYLQYRSKINAYRGLESLFAGDDFGVTQMADGLLGSIVMSIVLGAVVLLTVMTVTLVTRKVLTGGLMILVSFIVLGALGSLIAAYILATPVVAARVPDAAASYLGQWRYAAGDAIIPGLVGLALGWYLAKRAEDRELREMNAPVILTKTQREARDAEIAEREERARVNRERLEKSSAADTAGPESALVEAPAAASPVATTPPPSTARRSIFCRSCGSSNAPIRDKCLNCGAVLEPNSAN